MAAAALKRMKCSGSSKRVSPQKILAYLQKLVIPGMYARQELARGQLRCSKKTKAKAFEADSDTIELPEALSPSRDHNLGSMLGCTHMVLDSFPDKK
jgi:hypothetical protein